MGAPKRSQRMMVTKTEKPSPGKTRVSKVLKNPDLSGGGGFLPLTQKLSTAPWQGMRRRDIRTELIEGWRCTSTHTGATPTRPIFETALNQTNADQHHRGTSHNRRKYAQHGFGRDERNQHLEQRADRRGTDEGAVAIGTGQLGPVGGSGAEAICIHLGEGVRGDGDRCERDADDGDDTGAEIVSARQVSQVGSCGTREGLVRHLTVSCRCGTSRSGPWTRGPRRSGRLTPDTAPWQSRNWLPRRG